MKISKVLYYLVRMSVIFLIAYLIFNVFFLCVISQSPFSKREFIDFWKDYYSFIRQKLKSKEERPQASLSKKTEVKAEEWSEVRYMPRYSNILVTEVIDGETLRLENGEEVKLIGIDCPDIDTEAGKEAADFVKRLVEGKEVCL